MKNLIFKLIRYSGLPFFFREFIQKNKVSILLFHDISKDDAEKAFAYLSRKYNIISLQHYLDAVHNATKLPSKSLIITFDDGHASNFDLLSVVKKYDILVTIFLCASIVNTNRHFWFLHEPVASMVEDLKKISNKKRLEKLTDYGFLQEEEHQHPEALSKEQIEEMSKWFDFQSHTKFHPVLPQCTNAEAADEIIGSKQILENDFLLNIHTLSYPNGDYSDRDIQLAKTAGYICGITVDFGYNTTKTDLFRLKRLSVNDTGDINELAVKASGVWAFIKTRNGKKQPYGFSNKL
jgi:peptidoglycan/xylan/chitin deacetylase (PgdA/CDA1 family)